MVVTNRLGTKMPKRFLANRPGFLDGMVYLYSIGYMIFGSCWMILREPALITEVVWFDEFMTNHTMGLWFLILGALVVVLQLLWQSRLLMTLSLSVAIFTSLFPGLVFCTAWVVGLYPRGVIPGVLLLFLTFVLWWTAFNAYRSARQDSKEIEQAREG